MLDFLVLLVESDVRVTGVEFTCHLTANRVDLRSKVALNQLPLPPLLLLFNYLLLSPPLLLLPAPNDVLLATTLHYLTTHHVHHRPVLLLLLQLLHRPLLLYQATLNLLRQAALSLVPRVHLALLALLGLLGLLGPPRLLSAGP
jgi:hypothetical protein